MRCNSAKSSTPGSPICYILARHALRLICERRIVTEEEKRLAAARAGKERWRQWGPYLSERQWGTVREDYSANGTAWEYFPHDHARSRAYRWARTASRASATTSSGCASRWHCGTAPIRF